MDPNHITSKLDEGVNLDSQTEENMEVESQLPPTTLSPPTDLVDSELSKRVVPTQSEGATGEVVAASGAAEPVSTPAAAESETERLTLKQKMLEEAAKKRQKRLLAKSVTVNKTNPSGKELSGARSTSPSGASSTARKRLRSDGRARERRQCPTRMPRGIRVGVILSDFPEVQIKILQDANFEAYSVTAPQAEPISFLEGTARPGWLQITCLGDQCAWLPHARLAISGPSTASAKTWLEHSSLDLRVLTAILTGHYRLRNRLNKLAFIEYSSCRLCEEDIESMEHVMC
ncbi:hypothetical protein HHI36_003856 [Cryptolaemus montrouzieri]|uniref:Uncharacterized protein n=1 Tax=Cryptolaemus montrouzieri TaxID=559131 RepID=A0ABD2NPT1_9CUCU